MGLAMKKVFSVLKFARFIGAVAMLGAVVAGACGYGDLVKLWVAGSGAGLAVALKVAHVV